MPDIITSIFLYLVMGNLGKMAELGRTGSNASQVRLGILFFRNGR